jgi:hypothetical protein
MTTNYLVVLGTAIIPIVVGFIWYHPKVFGNAWMQVAGLKEEDVKKINMPLVLGLTLFLSMFISIALMFSVVHQLHIFASVMGVQGFDDPTTPLGKALSDFFEFAKNNFRTFKHGALHGTITGVSMALPLVAINALFERKGAKYVFIHAGFWIVCFALMGGVICQFS